MTDTRPRLVVTDHGRTVHVTTCWQARRPDVATAHLETENSGDLAREIATTDMQPCKKCKPVSRLAWWERNHR
jgi:hypothetical protein